MPEQKRSRDFVDAEQRMKSETKPEQESVGSAHEELFIETRTRNGSPMIVNSHRLTAL